MPIAVPISKALGPNPTLESVVAAIADVADTLARLATQSISHRDIKPGNLYSYDGSWAVGDFGLVDFPDKAQLTTDSRQLGPLYFHAPEMLEDPINAAGGPADVYSLTKTLFVLASGQKYPPPGQQHIDSSGETIGTWVRHPKVMLLDRLSERATIRNPSKRPTMDEMSQELRAWLTPPNATGTLDDLSELGANIRSLLEPRQRRVEVENSQIDLAQHFAIELAGRLKPIGVQIATILPSDGVVRQDHKIQQTLPYAHGIGMPKPIFKTGYCINCKSPGKYPVEMWTGFGLDLLDDGTVQLSAAHVIQGPFGRRLDLAGDTRFKKVIPLGSAQAEHASQELIDFLIEHVREAGEEYLDHLRSVSD
jgi:serine/threonine protein kinase